MRCRKGKMRPGLQGRSAVEARSGSTCTCTRRVLDTDLGCQNDRSMLAVIAGIQDHRGTCRNVPPKALASKTTTALTSAGGVDGGSATAAQASIAEMLGWLDFVHLVSLVGAEAFRNKGRINERDIFCKTPILSQECSHRLRFVRRQTKSEP